MDFCWFNRGSFEDAILVFNGIYHWAEQKKNVLFSLAQFSSLTLIVMLWPTEHNYSLFHIYRCQTCFRWSSQPPSSLSPLRQDVHLLLLFIFLPIPLLMSTALPSIIDTTDVLKISLYNNYVIIESDRNSVLEIGWAFKRENLPYFPNPAFIPTQLFGSIN